MHDRSQSTSPGLLRGPRLKRASYFVTASLLSLVFVAACGSSANSPGVANIDSTATTAAGSSSTTATAASPISAGSRGNAAAYSQCMRTHGIADFPDPDSQGNISAKFQKGSDLNPSNPAFQAAQNACKTLQPVPSAAQQQSRAQLLKYSQCMRTHGIADFPDPDSQGGLMITAGSGSDMNPNNPAFQAAQQACKSLLPKGMQPGGQ